MLPSPRVGGALSGALLQSIVSPAAGVNGARERQAANDLAQETLV
jgi:hypothetical protein